MNKRKRICEAPACLTRSSFNASGAKMARFCKQHGEYGMENVISKRCQTLGCKRHPTFNTPGATTARFCKEHAEDGMEDIKNKRCQTLGCKRHPTFNTPGATTARFCKEHAEDGMEDIKNKRCQTLGCSTRPAFNIPGATTARFCKEHAEDGMEDIKNKRCQTLGCRRQPVFNTPGATTGRFCKEHAEDGMEDIKNKRCCAPGCRTRSYYGTPIRRKIHCAKHRAPNEFIVQSCLECRKAATHSASGRFPPVTCETHALATDVALFEARCAGCGFEFLLFSDGRCSTCTDTIVRHRKEDAVYEFLRYAEPRQEGSAPRWTLESRDSRVQGECSSRYRPDFVLDRAGVFKIVVEVDEQQHSSYPEACECKRMRQIFEDFAGLPVIFVRFNPDVFVDTAGVRQAVAQKARLRCLGKVLHGLRNTEMLPGLLCMKQLFYDGCNDETVVLS